MFDDLSYVKFRQQELWREAAAQALAAQCQPERPRWRTWVLEVLNTVFSPFPRRASGPVNACPVHAAVGMTHVKNGGQSV